MSEWQPIDTAPKDGTRIILWLPVEDVAISGFWEWVEPERIDGHQLYSGFYDWFVDNDYVIFDSEYRPTHWMPMPKVTK
jgi:hypothetical protein